jgi:hypothetical protein
MKEEHENRRSDDSQNPVKSRGTSTRMRFLVAHARKRTVIIDFGHGSIPGFGG